MATIDSATEMMNFAKPANLHKAINTLRGIVAGISCADGISNDEIEELVHWCSIHSHLRNRHPFSELLPVIEQSMQDGFVDEDEQRDILWLCGNFIDEGKYYDINTSSVQFLCGMIHGMMADKTLTDGEIQTLQFWMKSNDFLKGTYPFDELHSIIQTILDDGCISEDERNTTLAFMSNFVEFKDSYHLTETDFEDLREKYSVGGVCARDPQITFKDKVFCFTGESYRATRSEMKDEVEKLGGIFKTSVTKKTDFLIVGNAGNPCWAYSCYGRKIEDAMSLRKEGIGIQIVNEVDFWDAV